MSGGKKEPPARAGPAIYHRPGVPSLVFVEGQSPVYLQEDSKEEVRQM